MNKRLKQVALGILMSATFTNAQEKEIKKASDTYNNYAFMDAIGSYESLVKKGYTEREIYQNLSSANYLNADYAAASDWYGKLNQLSGYTMNSDELYQYAQSLKSLERYVESDALMEKLKEDGRGSKYIDARDYLAQIDKQSGRYEVKTLSLNSTESDYAPVFFGNQLIFTTARDTGLIQKNIHKWNDKSFSNLYQADLNENDEYVGATGFSKALNTKAHESSVVFTKDLKTVYFTRNNDTKGNFSKDKDGVSRLKLYRGILEDGNWRDITELPFNSDAYSVAHPALSPSEDKLYFASDMEGTTGASDIFVVDIKENGEYSTPRNIGKGINTESRETFPFVSADNVLYFASDGHPGLGGLDIFATDLSNENGDNKIVNVGRPVNSIVDDFSYIINSETKQGFFASNRAGGKGSDDIYGFEQIKDLDLDCHTLVEGIVKDKVTTMPIDNAKVIVVNAMGEQIVEGLTDASGNFNLQGDCIDGDYNILGSKIKYKDATTAFSISNANDINGVQILLDPIKKSAPIGTDLAKYLNIEPIYFDFDKWNIRQDASTSITKVINYMKAYPDVKVQVQSHTDSRAKDSYNEALSKRRADSTVAHMIANGIDVSRILSEGFGEKQLTNDCSNQTKCSEEKHQQNRRSEFIVVE